MKNVKRVFLIEDDESDTYFFNEAIKEIKNAILSDCAKNGNEALNKLQKCDVLPDIIFSDINMPKMDGIACLRAIKEDPSLSEIPVVILSSDLGKLDTVRQLGAFAFIKKPNDGNFLRQQIKNLLSLDCKTDLFEVNLTFETAALT